MVSRCDIHVHSKHSDRPSEWYLDRIGAPESFTEPLEIYRTARARGMDFVTISDHDSIAGALDIAVGPRWYSTYESLFTGGIKGTTTQLSSPPQSGQGLYCYQ